MTNIGNIYCSACTLYTTHYFFFPAPQHQLAPFLGPSFVCMYLHSPLLLCHFRLLIQTQPHAVKVSVYMQQTSHAHTNIYTYARTLHILHRNGIVIYIYILPSCTRQPTQAGSVYRQASFNQHSYAQSAGSAQPTPVPFLQIVVVGLRLPSSLPSNTGCSHLQLCSQLQ